MSKEIDVQARLGDALALLEKERLEGAFLSVLVAIAGTSRKRYCKGGSGKTFKLFLEEEIDKVLPLKRARLASFRDGTMLLTDILYEIARNALVHEAALPSDVRIEKIERRDQIQIRQEVEGIIFSDTFIVALGNAVVQAEENKELFPDRDKAWPYWLPYKRGQKP